MNHEPLTQNQKGFTLIELLVAISIIAIVATILVILINPIELIRQGRDSVRLNDLSNMEKAVNFSLQENPENIPQTLCFNISAPCGGASDDIGYNTRAINGSGWVKVNLNAGLSTSVLPADPINISPFVYKYQTNPLGTKWEIDAVLESQKYNFRMQTDNGANPQVYEIGSDRNIIP